MANSKMTFPICLSLRLVGFPRGLYLYLMFVSVLMTLQSVCSRTTTPPGNQCVYDGKSYSPGEEISRGQAGEWCYGTSCSPSGEIVRWDNFNCPITTPAITTPPKQIGCTVKGVFYPPGAKISQGQRRNWCYGTYCDLNGKVINWDDFSCSTTTQKTTPGTQSKSTTTSPRSPDVPPTTVSVCTLNGVTYQPGQIIQTSSMNCGYICGSNGEVTAIPCSTPPQTTPPLPQGCMYNGRLYPPDQTIQSDRNGCGVFCSANSEILYATCTIAPTTTPTLSTTTPTLSTATPTLSTTTPPPKGCLYNGQVYPPGQPIQTDGNGCGIFCSMDSEILYATCTRSPTTTPFTTLPRGCIYNGKQYPPGTAIQSDSFGCGAFCSESGILLLATCPPTTTTTLPPPPTTVSVCLYNGVTYQPGQQIWRDEHGCGFECGPNGQAYAYPCQQPTTTPPYTTRHGCIHEGKVYQPGENFGDGQSGSWCYGMYCQEDGNIAHWDNFNCDPTTPTPTPMVRQTTTPVTTQLPGCMHEGRLYRVGERFGEGKNKNWCYGMVCEEGGNVLVWDNFHCDPTTATPSIATSPPSSTRRTTTPFPGCFFNTRAYLPGDIIERDSNGCGRFCSNEGRIEFFVCTSSVTRTTTIPTTTVKGCVYDGKVYPIGARFGEGKSGPWCFGMICSENGEILAWDNFECDSTSSSQSPTTSPSSSVRCLHKGKYYLPGEEISRVQGTNVCYGTLCDTNGDVISWEDFTCGNSTEDSPDQGSTDCEYQGRHYKPGEKISVADNRGCKVYCSRQGRIRIERFPCLSPVTNAQKDEEFSDPDKPNCIRMEDADPSVPEENICYNTAVHMIPSSLLTVTSLSLFIQLFI